MTNENLSQQPTDLELQLALQTKSGKQEGEESKQEKSPTDVGDPDSSRKDSGTDDSSRTIPSKEEVLGSLTLEELRTHPTLGPQIKSFADQEAARQLRGKTNQIREEERERLITESARTHFDSLSKEELAEELAADPEAAELYGKIRAMPPPTSDPEAAATIQYYTRTIKSYASKITAAGLPKEIADTLAPENFLTQGGDSDEVLEKWTSAVDEAVMKHRIAAEVSKLSREDPKSKELEKEAEEDSGKKEALLVNGKNTPALPDLTKTPGTTLLEDAFTRKAARR